MPYSLNKIRRHLSEVIWQSARFFEQGWGALVSCPETFGNALATFRVSL